MSLLYTVVFETRCRSNHHRLAIDALRHLQSPRAGRWRNLFLHHHEAYLEGAKAPDTEFKDFKNHVLHVRDGEWGGAIEAAEEWYRRTVRALSEKDWKQAAWSAGVMSHYYVDPIQPFHTHQSEEEGVIHRAVEWSFSKSYKTFQAILAERGGYPEIEVPQSENWLADMVRAGANASNPHYETVIEHYNFEIGRKNPPAGLDQEIKDIIAGLVGHAAVGLARILDRAFDEAAVKPPKVSTELDIVFYGLQVPIQAVLKKIDDVEARREVASQYEEFRRTGKVRATLGEDDKVVRALFATEVLKQPLSSLDAKWPREIGAKAGQGAAAREIKPKRAGAPKPKPSPRPKPAPKPAPARELQQALEQQAPAIEQARADSQRSEPRIPRELPEGAPRPKQEKRLPRFTLDGRANVEKAPSIGPKTAKRLAAIGIRTVDDLLAADPEHATQLKVRHITPDVIRDWQSQAELACTVPGLKSREAQALVACGVRDSGELAQMDAEELTEGVARWGLSDEGARAWGNAPAPSVDDVATWIERARRAASETEAA